MQATWKSLGLAPWLLKVCNELKYKEPAPIQVQTIPPILSGTFLAYHLATIYSHSLVASSRTECDWSRRDWQR